MKQKVFIPIVGGGPQTPDEKECGIRAWVIHGASAGPRVLVCAGVHGDEYEGPRALQLLSQELDTSDIRGCLVIVPVVNEGAMGVGARCHPGDGKNLARVFPGYPHGSVSERLAFTFVHEFLKGADYFIDLHSASSPSRILPWAGYQIRSGKVQDIQRRMAIAFGLDIVWGTVAREGRTLSAAGDLGIPSIYVEMPGEGRCRPDDVEKNRQGVIQTLAAIGMIEGDFPTEPPNLFVESTSGESAELDARHLVSASGAFHPDVALGDWIQVGDRIGTVVDALGETRCEVFAEVSGCVVHLRTFPSVMPGDSVATVLETQE